MAYAQWVVMTVGATGTTLSIKNAQVAWGKFFQYNDKDREVSSDDINKIQITSGSVAVIASCGREDAASGTEGSFDIVPWAAWSRSRLAWPRGDIYVGEISWTAWPQSYPGKPHPANLRSLQKSKKVE
jgi:hypothetical protein